MDKDKKTIKVRKKYDRFSYFYDFLDSIMEKSSFSRWRENLLKNLKGNILEIGVGTGKNLQYYNKNVKVIGIDLSPKMLKKAKEKLKILKNKNIKLIAMDAQNLNFKNNSFDYIVCTFVLCSVSEPVKVLKEMKRVLKKNGRILILEHTISKHFLIRVFQHIHNPITKTLFGFNVNRDTINNIKKAGLKPRYKDLALFDVFKRIEIKNGKEK